MRPAGAAAFGPDGSLWQIGRPAARSFEAPGVAARLTVLGWCGATDAELRALARLPVPDEVACRWPGAYAVVEQHADHTVVHTDPTATLPLYATPYGRGWAWSSSARVLAGLISAAPDPARVAVGVFLPHVPAAAADRSFFIGVRQLPPGARIELSDGTLRSTTVWRPDPVPGPADGRLRAALEGAVRLRVAADPELTCDLSGGLDSTTLALLAAAARPAGGVLNAVTVHPAGRRDGADLTYARLAAAHHPRIAHHLLPLSAEHLPYTDIAAVPATDEPAPSTLARTRLEGQLRWLRERFGGRTHLTGDGGDSVLFLPPAHLADLVRHRRYGRAVAEAAGWARLRRTSALPLLRDAHALGRTSRAGALADLAVTLAIGTPPQGGGRGDVGWFPVLPLPRWATADATRLLSDAVRQAAVAGDSLPGFDVSVRVLVDEVREIARTAAADAQLAAAFGVELHNPFLDPRVVDAVLRTELRARPAMHAYKPVLVRAMGDVLPAALATRKAKGSFDADYFTGLRTNLPTLRRLVDGHLAALGLVDPDLLRADLDRAATGIPMSLAALEQALTAEAWLRAVHHASDVWVGDRGGHHRD